MANGRYSGMLGMMQGPGTSSENIGGGIMGLPYPMGGMLSEIAKTAQHEPIENGSIAVDNMLSSGDQNRRFKVYRRKLNSFSGDTGYGTSRSSLAHWFFIDDTGKGFGFYPEGERVEIPDDLSNYEEHPSFAGKTYTASGLNKARGARQKYFEDLKQYIRENPDMYPPLEDFPELGQYNLGGNNCQHYVKDLDKFYEEQTNR